MSASRPEPGATPEHYSYTLYADPTHAGQFERLRFSGPIGTLLAEVQAEVLAGFLPDVAGRAIIDVGTGTGRGALALARRGARVTGVDASEQMLDIARQHAHEEKLSVEFRAGDAHRLDFANESFDAAVSLRVLMHTPDWRRCLGELCRVAKERVIFDYPAACSAAALQALGRHALAAFGVRTEAYRVFTDRVVRAELGRHGFAVAGVHRQFVLPIALHKAIGSRGFTHAVEAGLGAVGLLGLFGSPVTIVATREGRR